MGCVLGVGLSGISARIGQGKRLCVFRMAKLLNGKGRLGPLDRKFVGIVRIFQKK